MSLLTRFIGARHARLPGPLTTTVNFSSLGLLANDPFTVPSYLTVVMDIDSPSLGYTDIFGTVKDNGTAKTLTTTGITVESGGTLQIGTAAVPFAAASPFTISLTGAYVPLTNTTIAGFTQPTNPGTSRAIMVMPGGTLDLHGTPPSTLYTTINASAIASASTLTLATSPAWASGDAVVVAPTDFKEYGAVEQFTLSGATSGTSATLSGTLAAARYGVLQYPTDTGLSTTSGTFSTYKASANVPTVLDERARVANLTRNVVVSCPNDTDWSTKGHGVVIMAMASNGTTQATMRVEGTQLRRAGQRSATGRYPFHWHMMSYTSGGTFTADVSGSYIRKSVVWDSENRAYTIHGTCGVELSDNISYNVKGHAYFLEDGSEQRNTIQRNMAFWTKDPNLGSAIPGSITSISGDGTTTTVNWTSHGLYSGETLTVTGASIGGFNVKRTPVTVVNANQFTYLSTGNGTPTGASFIHGDDRIKIHDGNSSGYWITNLNNTIEYNYSGYNPDGHGAWIAISTTCFGLSASVALNPNQIAPLSLKGFTCHSSYGFGLMHNRNAIDEAGNVGSTTNRFPDSGDGTFFSTDHSFWKNSTGAYNNNTNIPRYQRWTVADNGSTDWSGSTNNGGLTTDCLGVGISLNNVHTQPSENFANEVADYGSLTPRCTFVSYHGTVLFQTNSWFNYAYVPLLYRTNNDKGAGGGMAQGGVDFYDIAGVDRTNGQNSGNKLYNTHPGPMAPTIHLDNRNVDPNSGSQRHYSLSSVWLDLDGKYGTAGKYMMAISPATGLVDDYFLNSATNLADGPVSGTAVCKTTDTKFMGFGQSDIGSWALRYAGTPVNGNLSGPGGADVTGNWNPITVTRQDPSAGTTIGTPFLIKRGDTGWGLANYRNVTAQNGGRFQIDFSELNTCTISIASPAVVTFPNLANHGLTAGHTITFSTTGALPTGITAGTTYYVISTGLTGNTFQFSTTSGGSAVNTSGSQSGVQSYQYALDVPDQLMMLDIYSPNPAVGDYMLLGLPWANASVPRISIGNNFSNESVSGLLPFGGARNTFASAADVTAGRAIIPNTSGASIAAALADTTGMTYFRDTTNNRIWIRYTNRNGSAAALTANTKIFGVDVQTIVVKV